jgi:hypothetical protein
MWLRKLIVVPVVALGFFVLAPAASAWMADMCISFGGHTIYDSGGTANCETTEGHNLAVALGADTWANASNGEDNVSLAVGAGSQADTDEGNRNKAVSIHSGLVEVTHGNDNTGIAIHSEGNQSGEAARAGDGNHNTAVAIYDSVATAHGPDVEVPDDAFGLLVDVEGGNNNTSIAINGSYADTFNGSNNTAIAKNDSNAVAKHGDDNEAVALHRSDARAQDGNNTAIAKDNSTACAGGTCQPPCPKPTDATVECISITENGRAENNLAVAVHWSEAYAGGVGDFDWNTAIAIGNCIAEAVWSTGDSDFCGPHHNNLP